MQQVKRQEHIFNGIIGIGWVVGLLIAGSDSDYMPLINGAGLLLFLGTSLLLGKRLNRPKQTGTVIFPDFWQQRSQRQNQLKIKNKRHHSRYALSA